MSHCLCNSTGKLLFCSLSDIFFLNIILMGNEWCCCHCHCQCHRPHHRSLAVGFQQFTLKNRWRKNLGCTVIALQASLFVYLGVFFYFGHSVPCQPLSSDDLFRFQVPSKLLPFSHVILLSCISATKFFLID